MKKLIPALILSVGVAYAQTAEKPVNISVGGGVNTYKGDLGNGFFSQPFSKSSYGHGSLNLGVYLNKSFDLLVGGTYGEYGYFTPNDSAISTTSGKKADFKSRLGTGILNLKYKLDNGYILKETSKISPYIHGGVGFVNVADYFNGRAEAGSDVALNLGLGLGIKLSEVVNLNINLLNFGAMMNADNFDKYSKDKPKVGAGTAAKDFYMQHGASLGFNIGGPKDDDKDGVPNRIDKCPGTPEGVAVDITGCPVDKDGDGVADYQDKCPDVPGVAGLAGCPDTDKDGIADAEDKCPTVAGVAALMGCPDTDGDGITDAEDKCPAVKGIAAMKGCPDSDGDGITDAEDACPNAKGPASLKGCPDSDGDGVLDKDDKCPTVAGSASAQGCPEVKEEAKKVFQQAMAGIQFETGKDVIKKTSYGILNQVVNVMQTNPSYKVYIEGHTDNVGNPVKNQELSQKRANAVQKYLTDKGVESSRILGATGFGSDKPIADNATAAGKAKNRRVEFKVEF
jgi:OmpA-OmpF porin, OOP family